MQGLHNEPVLFKGQSISKCPFGVFKSPKKPTKYFPRFLPQPLKRGKIKKIRALYTANWTTFFHYFFDLTSFQRLGQKSSQKFPCFFGRFGDTKKDISKLTDLQRDFRRRQLAYQSCRLLYHACTSDMTLCLLINLEFCTRELELLTFLFSYHEV